MRKNVIIFFTTLMLFATNARAITSINDTETEILLTKLITPLTRTANIPDNRLQIHIIANDDFNAFVAGGDDIYIYTGLLTQIKSPDALQAVIAHELGHTLGGHMVQMSARLDTEMKRMMFIQALGIGLMAMGGNSSLGAGILAGSGGVATQSILSFSRDEERIADNMGLDLMVRANLNPNGFINIFEQMLENTAAAEATINPNRINHPLTRERLKNIRDRINKMDLKKTYVSTTNIDEYELVRAKLIGYLNNPEQIKSIYPYSNKSNAAIYARAISAMRTGRLNAAITGTKTLISRTPQNPYFYELLGDIEYQLGHYDDSIIAYKHSLKLSNNAPQIQTALALVLAERNNPDDITSAIQLAKQSILNTPTPLAYWILSRTYTDGRADWARAEYYNMMGNIEQAKIYAKRAKQSLNATSPEYIKSDDILLQTNKK